MKKLQVISCSVLFMLFLQILAIASKPMGFFLPDSVASMTLTYRTVDGLIVLPVTINDSIEVNLVLDTGCRNLILFGKRFKKLLQINSDRLIEFSGLGNGKPVGGRLSLGNKVSINHVLGHEIPVVIVGENKMFGVQHRVDGVIGYDIFVKFEIELNPSERSITFRPAHKVVAPEGYTVVPLQILDSRPILQSDVYLRKGNPRTLPLMIDTGSTLGLLLKTTNISEFERYRNEEVLGLGLNGHISGFTTVSDKVLLEGMELTGVKTGVVSSNWHDNASIGMGVLKDYVFILNYCKRYACFKII